METATIEVMISGASLRQRFHRCDKDYIRDVCQGRCCQSKDGILVTIHISERDRIESLGPTVQNGFIQADKRGLCPFKTDDGFCCIHKKWKPFGCRASPFTLNKNGTLIIRNRYRLLRCYACKGSLPAYKAHRWSLEQIFGETEAERIAGLSANGANKFPAHMPIVHYWMLLDNDAAKRMIATKKYD